MATAAQLKALRKKHGLGEFRKKKSNRKSFRRRIRKFKRALLPKSRARRASGSGARALPQIRAQRLPRR